MEEEEQNTNQPLHLVEYTKISNETSTVITCTRVKINGLKYAATNSKDHHVSRCKSNNRAKVKTSKLTNRRSTLDHLSPMWQPKTHLCKEKQCGLSRRNEREKCPGEENFVAQTQMDQCVTTSSSLRWRLSMPGHSRGP